MESKTIRAVAQPKPPVNLTDLYVDFAMQYRNVFIFQVEENSFIYRSLGRGEYREILQDKRFSDLKKEELICSQCLLYPDPQTIDWDEWDAGVPSVLLADILKHSYLDDVNMRRQLHNYYRKEMYEMDNQITCLINEAFPNYDIEEIEKWDVEKTTKYLSRAEWKLQNLRGINIMTSSPGANVNDTQQQQAPQQARTRTQKNEQVQKQTKKNDSGRTIRGGSRANKLTPEKMREREEFLRKFPEFAGHDNGFDGVESFKHIDVDDRPAALRPGF